MGFLDLIIVLFLIFWGTFILFSTVGCTNLHAHQLPSKVPFSLHASQHLFPLVFFIIAILTDERWCSLWLWFTFLWWLVIVSTFSCTCYLFKSTLWRKKSIQVLYPIFKKQAIFFFFTIEFCEFIIYFGYLTSCQKYGLRIFFCIF